MCQPRQDDFSELQIVLYHLLTQGPRCSSPGRCARPPCRWTVAPASSRGSQLVPDKSGVRAASIRAPKAGRAASPDDGIGISTFTVSPGSIGVVSSAASSCVPLAVVLTIL